MKAINHHGLLKAIAFIFLAISLFSCSSCDDEPNPPVILTKAIAVIRPAANVKINSATIVATITPNEDDTKASFEIKETAKSTWESHILPATFSGKDTLKVTFDFSDLKAGTSYDFRIKVANKAGEAVSEINSFETYAVSDYDGNLYHAVTIGNQIWLKENLKAIHFANGDPIPNVTDQTQWNATKTPAYCWYENNASNGKEYGGLYNWYVVSDSRGLIKGWHVPANSECITLSTSLGGDNVAAGPLKEAGFKHWESPNNGATNSSGFTALPSGARTENFGALGSAFYFWTSTPEKAVAGAYTAFVVKNSNIFYNDSGIFDYGRGLSIRLVKD